MAQIGLEKIQDPLRTTPDEHLGHLRAADGFPDDELQRSSIEPVEGQISPSYPGQDLFRREIHHRSRVGHRLHNGCPRTQDLPKKGLLIREVPVDQSRRLQPRSLRDALDRRPLKALDRELLESRFQDLAPPIRLLLALLAQNNLLIDRSITSIV